MGNEQARSSVIRTCVGALGELVEPLKAVAALVGLYLLVVGVLSFIEGWRSVPGQDELEKACAHYCDRDYQACMDELETVIRKDPQRAEAYYLRARARSSSPRKSNLDWELIVEDLKACIACDRAAETGISGVGKAFRGNQLYAKMKEWKSGCRITARFPNHAPTYTFADVLRRSQLHAKYFLIEICTDRDLSGTIAPNSLHLATELFEKLRKESPYQLLPERCKLSCQLAEALIRHGKAEEAERVLDESHSSLISRCDSYVAKIVKKYGLEKENGALVPGRGEDYWSDSMYETYLKDMHGKEHIADEFMRLASVYEMLKSQQRVQECYEWTRRFGGKYSRTTIEEIDRFFNWGGPPRYQIKQSHG